MSNNGISCNIEKRLYEKQGKSQSGKIFISKNGKYVIKSIIKSENEEKKYILKLMDKVRDSPMKIFFVDVKEILDCGKYNYYFMPEYDGMISTQFINGIDYDLKISLLLQILAALFYLNYEVGIYHSDLFSMENGYIKNIAYKKWDDETIYYRALDENIKIKKYCCKIIDFGYAKYYPSFKTSKYYTKYFKHIPFISELFVYTFIYLINTKGKEKVDNKARNTRIYQIMNNVAAYIINKYQPKDSKEFDIYFYKIIKKLLK